MDDFVFNLNRSRRKVTHLISLNHLLPMTRLFLFMSHADLITEIWSTNAHCWHNQGWRLFWEIENRTHVIPLVSSAPMLNSLMMSFPSHSTYLLYTTSISHTRSAIWVTMLPLTFKRWSRHHPPHQQSYTTSWSIEDHTLLPHQISWHIYQVPDLLGNIGQHRSAWLWTLGP